LEEVWPTDQCSKYPSLQATILNAQETALIRRWITYFPTCTLSLTTRYPSEWTMPFSQSLLPDSGWEGWFLADLGNRLHPHRALTRLSGQAAAYAIGSNQLRVIAPF